MKYMLSWDERPQGSPMEYENAQKRILEIFTQRKAPDNFKIELFVIRGGRLGWIHDVGLRRSTRGPQSSARCCPRLSSRRAPWSRSWMRSELNSKRWLFAMGSNAS